MIDLTGLFQAFITLLAAIVTSRVIPYINSKTTSEQRAQLQEWSKIGVAAAEQIYSGSGRGAEKKKFVMDFLTTKGFKVDLDTVSAMIEAEVNNLWQDQFATIQTE